MPEVPASCDVLPLIDRKSQPRNVDPYYPEKTKHPATPSRKHPRWNADWHFRDAAVHDVRTALPVYAELNNPVHHHPY